LLRRSSPIRSRPRAVNHRCQNPNGSHLTLVLETRVFGGTRRRFESHSLRADTPRTRRGLAGGESVGGFLRKRLSGSEVSASVAIAELVQERSRQRSSPPPRSGGGAAERSSDAEGAVWGLVCSR
jgi:hypothetical protein